MSNFAQAQSESTDESQKKQEKFKKISNEYPKFCIHCGAPLEDDNEFCTECGTKIESELAFNESVSEKASLPPQKICSDRLASIKETAYVKLGGLTDEFRKNKLESEKANQLSVAKLSAQMKSTLKTGYYIHKDSEKTQYLIIENVCGNSVIASVKSTFYDGSYSTEHYTGTISAGSIELSISETDLHPLPNQRWETMTDITTITNSIRVSDHFSGTFSENKIAGNFSGEFSTFIVFTRI